jgi:hypothetical protein
VSSHSESERCGSNSKFSHNIISGTIATPTSRSRREFTWCEGSVFLPSGNKIRLFHVSVPKEGKALQWCSLSERETLPIFLMSLSIFNYYLIRAIIINTLLLFVRTYGFCYSLRKTDAWVWKSEILDRIVATGLIPARDGFYPKRSRNGWLSPILSFFSLRFRDDKTLAVTVPSVKPWARIDLKAGNKIIHVSNLG